MTAERRLEFNIFIALTIEGPVLIGIPVDYRKNYKLMETLHAKVLN